MDTTHFHTGIKQEDTGRKNNIIEVGKIREEAAVEIHVGLSAGCQINDAQDNQQGSRDNCTDHTTDLGYLTYPAHTFQRNESCQPVNDKNYDEGVILVVC